MSDLEISHIESDIIPVIEAAIFSSAEPLTADKLLLLFSEENQPSREVLKEALLMLESFYDARAINLVKVATGYRFQTKSTHAQALQRLWEKKPPRYTRALLETLALIVYQQPITRGEIEAVRGVAVSSQIIKTLQEREWIKVLGFKELPGKPALFGTTKKFLEYFNLNTLSDLPPLQDLVNLDELGDIFEDQTNKEVLDQAEETEFEASLSEPTQPELESVE